MSGSGRAGYGRGNSRKHLFRRLDKENGAWQESSASESGASRNGDKSRSEALQKGAAGFFDKRPNNKESHTSFSRQHSQPSGRGGNNRGRTSNENQNRQNRSFSKRSGDNSRGEKAPFIERPKWIPPVINSDPLPVPDCPWCGKPIRDLSSAMADKETGVPVHFDCVAARIAVTESLEAGELVSYIGAGRFGVINFSGAENHDFKIKKIIEWENKDIRADWRSKISDHYSIT